MLNPTERAECEEFYVVIPNYFELMREELMYGMAHDAGLDVYHDGERYVIHFATNMEARPLRLSHLENVMMLIKAVLEN